ncbi:MAG: HEAT repeat domain-containing protein [Phycisphaeraceae bacterium]|nr:HEAT repeat domain-containing protein [Phycisphaeraceae bacterium]
MSQVRELIGKFESETSLFRRVDLLSDLSRLGGPEVLALLSKALNDSERMVQENAARCLGRMGTAEANRVLIEALDSDNPTLQKNAAEALGRGQVPEAIPALQKLTRSESWSLQYTAKRAIEAIEAVTPNDREPTVDAPEVAEEVQADYQKLIQEATRNLGADIQWNTDGHQHQVTLPLPGDRKQVIYLGTGGTDSDGAPLIHVYTLCAPATPENHERALIYNMRISYGALAISEIQGKKMFVIVDALLAKSASPLELRKAICSLARHGDKVEKNLTGKDIY